MNIIRRVLPHEFHKYATHLISLDNESKRSRFTGGISDSLIEKMIQKMDPKDHVLFCIEDINLDFIAVAHIALGPEVEFAFSVLKPYQNKGIGMALMKKAIRYCKTHGYLTGYMSCYQSNHAVKKLCNKLKIKMSSEEGETIAVLNLSKPNMGTYLDEGFDYIFGEIDFFAKRQINILMHQLLIISN
jgi:GNAT superfamily N-acetyltransferase